MIIGAPDVNDWRDEMPKRKQENSAGMVFRTPEEQEIFDAAMEGVRNGETLSERLRAAELAGRFKQVDAFARPDRPKDQGELSAAELHTLTRLLDRILPVTLSVEQAEELLAAVDESKVSPTTMHNLRCSLETAKRNTCAPHE
jgi:hypothetical protein